MSENVCQPNIPLIMGTVSGPVFGLFDISNIEEESFCQINLLRKVPIGLINLSQVIVIMRPDQVKRHQCSGNRCAFSQIDFANIPQVDYVCRAWFPNEESGGNQWPEASISIGGAMLAAYHLREMTTEHDRTWTFAFWSPLTSTWEILGADSKTDLTGRVTVYRKDFSPPENIYAHAKKSIPSSDIDIKSDQLTDILNLSANNSNGSVDAPFAVTVVHDRKWGASNLDNLGVNYFFVPFLVSLI